MSALNTFCGVPIEAEGQSGITTSQEAEDLYGQIYEAILEAKDSCLKAVADDNDRKSAYEVQSPSMNTLGFSSERVTGVSLLRDCKMPLVPNFQGFWTDFVNNGVDPRNVPRVAVERDTFAKLRPGILGLKLGQLKSVKKNHSKQLRMLLRLSLKDKEWKDEDRWLRSFAQPLDAYLVELFNGRFRDRNGLKVPFDHGISIKDLSKIKESEISPKLVGVIASTFVEYVGDQIFKVPFYSPEILKANRDYRKNKKAEKDASALIRELEQSIRDGELSEELAKKIGVSADSFPVVLNWAKLGGSPIYESELARRLVQLVPTLDEKSIQSVSELKKSVAQLDKVDLGTSALQKSFSCHKAGVITGHLENVFLSDRTGKTYGDEGRDSDTGGGANDDSKQKFQDYADIVGKVVAYSAARAEKTARTSVGLAARGVWMGSLDNEVLAEWFSATAGALAKKSMEKIAYEGLKQTITGKTGDKDAKRKFLTLLEKLHDEVTDSDE